MPLPVTLCAARRAAMPHLPDWEDTCPSPPEGEQPDMHTTAPQNWVM